MLKRIYLLLPIVIFSLASNAQNVEIPDADASSICASLLYSKDKISCVEITNGQLFGKQALALCNNLLYVEDKLKCLSVTANQPYSKASLKICGDEIYVANKISCLEKAGLNKKDSSTDILKHAETEISRALYLIKMKDISEAQSVLQNLRYELSQKNK